MVRHAVRVVVAVALSLAVLSLPGCAQDDQELADLDLEEQALPAFARQALNQHVAELRERAEAGDASAQWDLAFYSFAVKHYTAAEAWYRRAAEQGHVGAQRDLARLYTNGLGVPQNNVEAYKWLSLSASRSITAVDQERRGRYRDALAERMTPEQLAEAQRRARAWDSAHPR